MNAHWKKHWSCSVVWLLALLMSVGAARADAVGCQAHYDRLLGIAEDWSQPGHVMRARLIDAQASFDEHHEETGFAAECRRLLFDSLYMVDFYVADQVLLARLRKLLSNLETLGEAQDTQRLSFFKALIGHRRFDEARAFRNRHPELELEDVPALLVNDVDTADAYGLDTSAGERLAPLTIELDGVRLVAVVHPLCGFSKRALEAIAGADLGLAPEQVVYLAPVDQMLHLAHLAEWNAAHPSVPIVLASTRERWSFIDEWATPNFYVLADGKVVAKLAGWPDEAQLGVLMDLLEKD